MKPTPQRAWVVAGGKRLETLWFAPETANAPTLVLLHEGLGSIAHWKDFPRRLAERGIPDANGPRGECCSDPRSGEV